MLRFGITSIQDMAHAYGPARTMAVLRAAELRLRVRVVGMVNTAPASRLLVDWDRVRSADTVRFASGGTVVTSGIKWILDGTPIERLALMRAPYSDAPGWYGRADFPPDTGVRCCSKPARVINN